MNKHKSLHLIDSLSRGGAETLLTGYLQEMSNYKHLIVTLFDQNDFSKEIENGGIEYISLSLAKPFSITQCIKAYLKLKKIIRVYQPSIMHSHLYWSTVLGRVTCPKSTPFFFTVHSVLGKDAFENSLIHRLIEKITYKRRHTFIATSRVVKEDYNHWIGIKGKAFVCPNFISEQFVKVHDFSWKPCRPLRVVAVGNLKPLKNYDLLIDALEGLLKSQVTIDVYGKGAIKEKLENKASRKNVPITFKGSHQAIHEVLPNYDLFIMPSLHEGFGLTPIEAMACGLPALLANIPALKEIAGDNALFFDPTDKNDLRKKLMAIINGEINLGKYGIRGYQNAQKYRGAKNYAENLSSIYNKVLCVE